MEKLKSEYERSISRSSQWMKKWSEHYHRHDKVVEVPLLSTTAVILCGSLCCAIYGARITPSGHRLIGAFKVLARHAPTIAVAAAATTTTARFINRNRNEKEKEAL